MEWGGRGTHEGQELRRPPDVCVEMTGRWTNGSGVQEVVCAADINLRVIGMPLVFRTVRWTSHRVPFVLRGQSS